MELINNLELPLKTKEVIIVRQPIPKGKRFGKWVVIETSVSKNGNLYSKCKCDCGTIKDVLNGSLRSGKTASCGCNCKVGGSDNCNYKHGRGDLYSIWRGIRYRCNNVEGISYHRYGGRGIKVCEEWDNFETFKEDMGKRPSKSHSIDRIDNDGDYCPDNCRWATSKEQANNRKSNRYLEFLGVNKTLTEWSEEVKISTQTLNCRLKRGWSIEKTLTTTVKSSTKEENNV